MLLLLYCVTFSTLKAQDVDAQGNLWVVTLDKSRSMTDARFHYKDYVFTKLLDTPLFSKIDFSKDVFVFYNSGYVYYSGKNYTSAEALNQLQRKNHNAKTFLDEFIRPVGRKNSPMTFKNGAAFKKSFKRMYGSWNTKFFPYCYSFVSLIQTMTLATFLEDYKELNLLNFRKIIFCSITDDADENDQWLQDYKTVRKHIPKKQQEIDSILNTLLYSPFSGTSHGIGTFSAVFPPIEKSGKPKLFVYEYQTRQGLQQAAAKNATIEIYAQQNDTIALQINSEVSKHHLVKLDSVMVNDELLPLSYPLILQKDSIQKVPAPLHSVFHNTISLHGVGQQIYTDDLLGERIQKVTINETHTGIYNVNSPLHRTNLILIGILLLGLLVVWMVYVIYKLHLPKCIIIGPAGETVIIKNGFKRIEKKKKIQYAGFTKDGNLIATVRLKDHFITNTQLAVDTSSSKKWIAVLSKKKLLFINDIDIFQFQKGATKHIQGVETAYHAKIRKKYGKHYAIYFIQYPTTDTSLNFTIKNDSSHNEYHIRASVRAEHNIKNELTLQNERMISNQFLKNEIATSEDYILVCNKIEDENTSLLYLNVIQPYTLKTFLPIQIVKHYKIKLNPTDDIQKRIHHEVAALEKELKVQLQKNIKLKAYYKDQIDTAQLLAITYPFFPVNLSLCSYEDTSANTRLKLYNSVTYQKEAVEKNTFRIKIERPSDVTIEPYSMQLLWHPHEEIYNMHLTDRKAYAINGKNYLDIGNPDTITLDVIKNNDQYIIKCQGQTLETHVQDYVYKPITNE